MSEDNQETDTQDNQETDEEPTFQVGDYRSFIKGVVLSIIHLLIALSIGIHVVYSLRHKYDEFMSEYFPTDKEKAPFCYTTQSDCKRSSFYRDTNVEVDKIINNGEIKTVKELYQPDFNIDNIVKEDSNGKKDIKGIRDFSYINWLLFWCNNSVMNSNIYTNVLFKYIYDTIHDIINKGGFTESIFVFFGFIIIAFIFAFMMFYSMGAMFISQFNAYEKYSWVLKYPVAAAFWFGFNHMLRGNTYQACISFGGILPGIFWKFFVVLGLLITAKVLPAIKFIRIYVKNMIMMCIYILNWIVSTSYNYLSGNTLDQLLIHMDSKYSEMLSMYNDYSIGILICISLIVLYYAQTYLTKGISIGMTICSIYLIFMSYANSDKEKK